MKKIFYILFFISFIFLFKLNVSAEEVINSNIKGSINGTLGENISVVDSSVYLYKVATMNTDAVFTKTAEFKDLDVDLKNIRGIDRKSFLQKVINYVNTNKPNYLKITKTNVNSGFLFDELDHALYYINVEDSNVNGKRVEVLPSMFSVPYLNKETGSYIYNVNLNMKVNYLDDNNNLNVNINNKDKIGASVPNTYDSIYIYIIIGTISLIGIIILLYIIIRRRKNEKDI